MEEEGVRGSEEEGVRGSEENRVREEGLSERGDANYFDHVTLTSMDLPFTFLVRVKHCLKWKLISMHRSGGIWDNT